MLINYLDYLLKFKMNLVYFSFLSYLCKVILSNSLIEWKNQYKNQKINCKNLFWLHPAKTSSSFCLSIQHVCCSELYKNITNGITEEMLAYHKIHKRYKFYKTIYDYKAYDRFVTFEREGHPKLKDHCPITGINAHDPLYRKENLSVTNVLTILREPKARLISSFLYRVHDAGFVEYNRTEYHELIKQMNINNANNSLLEKEKQLINAQLYANHPCVYGYQIKMILGIPRYIDFSIYNDTYYVPLVQKAANRLKDFFFVGIFEEYKKSMTVFHALSNKGTQPNDVELHLSEKGHLTNHKDATYLMKHVIFHDRYDTLLYQEAMRIFNNEIEYIKSNKPYYYQLLL